MVNVRTTLLAVTLTAALAGVASADRIKVAVVPGIAVNLDAARVDALSQDLADALATQLDVDAIGGLEVRRLLPADGIPPDCVATPTCVADVAKRTGANQLLFVVMVDTGTGGAIQIDSTWVDPMSSQSASRPAIDIAAITDAKSRFESSAKLLLPNAPVRPAPKVSSGGGIGGTMSVEVPRHLTTPAKITAGVALAGLGLGVGFGLVARSRYHTCEDRGNACSSSDRDSIRSVALVADLGYLLAIGGAVATTVLYTQSGEQSHLVVAPTAGGVAAFAVGRF